jgi:cell division protein FtsZ
MLDERLDPRASETPAPLSFASEPDATQTQPSFHRKDVVVEAAGPRQPFFPPLNAEPQPAPDSASIPPQAFIPPQAERASVRAQRMPNFADLPLPGQAILNAQRDAARTGAPEAGMNAAPSAPQSPEAKRMTLMQRLAAVGLGARRDIDAQETQAAQATQAEPQPQAQTYPSEAHQVYARRPASANPAQAPLYRPAQGTLDPQGRATPQQRTFEDDQLEIPAFLRRQAK